MRFIMTIIWAILIGSALAYVLSSMADDPFNFTQALGFAIASFIGIIVMDGVLSSINKQTE
ncbi:MAG TPA: DUF2929 family protein [Pseudogracilibacillus sp.]|nr:DUF2929 family protein [Pseudogracilibacillus sp.]